MQKKWGTSALTINWFTTFWHAQCHSMKAMWDVWLLMMIAMTKDMQTACIQDNLWKEKQVHIWSTDLTMQSSTSIISMQKQLQWRSQSQNKYSWEYGNVMKMSVVAWLIPWMGKYFALRQKKIKKTSMSADGNGRVDSRILNWTESHWTSNSPSVSGEDL